MQPHEKRKLVQSAAAVAGVDTGKGMHALKVRPRGGKDSKAFEFATTREDFARAVAFLRRQAPGAEPGEIVVGVEFAGVYGLTFAHYLRQHGFVVMSVLPQHTKHWKHIEHGSPLKTDAKDAQGITSLTAEGRFVEHAYLDPAYAELRYLGSARETVVLRRTATLSRLKAVLHVVWPEYERVCPNFNKKTPAALLRAYPGPAEFLAAPREEVIALLKQVSRNRPNTVAKYEQLAALSRETLGLPTAQGALRAEIPLLLDRLRLYERQTNQIERAMVEALKGTEDAQYLLSIPKVGAVTAAIFLGAIGDPRSYSSVREVLKLAGLALIEKSSGQKQGARRLSKRGRPALRQMAYMLAVRSIKKQRKTAAEAFWRDRYEALLARNGGLGKKALAVLMRDLVRVMFAVARDRRPWSLEAPPRPAAPEETPVPADSPAEGLAVVGGGSAMVSSVS